MQNPHGLSLLLEISLQSSRSHLRFLWHAEGRQALQPSLLLDQAQQVAPSLVVVYFSGIVNVLPVLCVFLLLSSPFTAHFTDQQLESNFARAFLVTSSAAPSRVFF